MTLGSGVAESMKEFAPRVIKWHEVEEGCSDIPKEHLVLGIEGWKLMDYHYEDCSGFQSFHGHWMCLVEW